MQKEKLITEIEQKQLWLLCLILIASLTKKKLQYNFVSKEALLKMNKRYLNHKTHTDIITFNYSSDDKLEAEFFVSFWAINKSAKEYSQTVENETLRVIIHGALHCMGYNDDNKVEIDNMRKMEDKFISMFHVKQNRYV